MALLAVRNEGTEITVSLLDSQCTDPFHNSKLRACACRVNTEARHAHSDLRLNRAYATKAPEKQPRVSVSLFKRLFATQTPAFYSLITGKPTKIGPNQREEGFTNRLLAKKSRNTP